MSEEAKYNKTVQNRKKEFQDKKVELISQLCAEERTNKKQDKKLESQK